MTVQDFKLIQGGKRPGVVLIKFWATWCNQCRIIAPILKSVADKLGLTLEEFDVSDAFDEIDLQSVPTVILYADGKERARLAGVHPEAEYLEVLQAALNT